LTDIEMFVDKAVGGFKRRVVIDWDDGAKTVLTYRKIYLQGVDGKVYKVSKNSEHANICRNLLTRNGHLIP
jgi:hypothetical protein